MAYSGHHRFYVFHHYRHLLIAFLAILLPLLGMVVLGKISNISTRILLLALGLSFFRLVVAYLASLVLAVIIAIILAENRFGDFFIPVLDIIQNLPSFALIPLFVLWLGYSDKMVILFAISSIIWPILFYMLSGLKTARGDLNEAAQIFGATGWRRVWYYLLPLSFPALVTGSIVAVSIGWEAIIGVEIIGSLQGVGTFLNLASGARNKMTLAFGIFGLLFLVFTINKLIWAPLLRRSHLYAE